MNVSIQKLSNGNVKVELTTATDKKPFRAELSPEKVEMLIGMLKTAVSSTAFEFSLKM